MKNINERRNEMIAFLKGVIYENPHARIPSRYMYKALGLDIGRVSDTQFVTKTLRKWRDLTATRIDEFILNEFIDDESFDYEAELKTLNDDKFFIIIHDKGCYFQPTQAEYQTYNNKRTGICVTMLMNKIGQTHKLRQELLPISNLQLLPELIKTIPYISPVTQARLSPKKHKMRSKNVYKRSKKK